MAGEGVPKAMTCSEPWERRMGHMAISKLLHMP
jgi:hypothetical protein